MPKLPSPTAKAKPKAPQDAAPVEEAPAEAASSEPAEETPAEAASSEPAAAKSPSGAEALEAPGSEEIDESQTSRWPSIDEEIAEDEGPSDSSMSRPVAMPRPVSVPPEIDPGESATGLRAPSLSEGSGVTPADSAAAWPGADGWDLDDLPDLGAPGDVAALSATAPRIPFPKSVKPASAPSVPPPPTPFASSDSAPAEAPRSGETERPAAAIEEASELPDIPIPEPSVPRLPVPGMLRDGAEPKAADFRARSRAASPVIPAAMPPPKGVAPPKLAKKDGEEEIRLKPGDTASFVAEVAVELMAEAKAAQREVEAAAEAEAAASGSGGAIAVLTPSSVIEPEEDERAAPVAAAAPAPPRGEDPERRPMLLPLIGGAAAALLGLLLWMGLRGGDEPTETAAAPSPPEAADAGDEDDAAKTPAQAEADDGATPVAVVPDLPADDVEAAGSTSGGGESSEGAAESSESGELVEEAAESTGEAIDEEPEAPEAVASSSRPKSRSTSRKPKPTTDEPAPIKDEPKTTPTSSSKPATAQELLAEARTAYRKGQGSKAYTLAAKSNRMSPTGEAAELMTLAACQMKNVDKARSALKAVPLLQRGKVRGTCKTKYDVKIPL
ncbi:MAG: hypothetical protein H6712_01340 [Myxococcales bacterium]|nr:hypothetical protein [Myxococcales bacterium]MCB9712469.1 hypothetical protein [Myxococcales bacterium]